MLRLHFTDHNTFERVWRKRDWFLRQAKKTLLLITVAGKHGDYDFRYELPNPIEEQGAPASRACRPIH